MTSLYFIILSHFNIYIYIYIIVSLKLGKCIILTYPSSNYSCFDGLLNDDYKFLFYVGCNGMMISREAIESCISMTLQSIFI